ncbi:hypothetical protein HDU96_002926 [Phlyctochytrium bullatum]|nr:hypothetical protein HDU96_002926 [Phlyctochytrium bullatum]
MTEPSSSASAATSRKCKIGVLGKKRSILRSSAAGGGVIPDHASDKCCMFFTLQGAFTEHLYMLQRITDKVESVKEVRKPEDLQGLDGLIIPGGESTAMALVAERTGILEPLREWVKSGKPTWGTCAGMIMLSNGVSHGKTGGQSLVGGLDIQVKRNAFGTQVDSFEMKLDVPAIPGGSFHGIFIRAPVVEVVSGAEVEVLAKVNRKDTESVVAVRQRNILATAFHPELTRDDRFHRFFVDMVLAA